MKYLRSIISHWLVIFLLTDIVFIFLAWLANPAGLKSAALFILLFTVLGATCGFLIERRRQKKIKAALLNYIDQPDNAGLAQLALRLDDSWQPALAALDRRLNEQITALSQSRLALTDYREFIESWVHEIKTPLSLATLVLENHKTEMSAYVYTKMSHVRQRIDEDIERILYYARLKADHRDYYFTKIPLTEFLNEMQEAFQVIARERGIRIVVSAWPLTVVCDRRVLRFMVSQLVSNAVKYAPPAGGEIHLIAWRDEETCLAVRDNGVGVRPEDARFIFDKGFSGQSAEWQNSTGMGLYLLKKYAALMSLAVKLEPRSDANQGFGIRIQFPEQNS